MEFGGQIGGFDHRELDDWKEGKGRAKLLILKEWILFQTVGLLDEIVK